MISSQNNRNNQSKSTLVKIIAITKGQRYNFQHKVHIRSSVTFSKDTGVKMSNQIYCYHTILVTTDDVYRYHYINHCRPHFTVKHIVCDTENSNLLQASSNILARCSSEGSLCRIYRKSLNLDVGLVLIWCSTADKSLWVLVGAASV